MLNSNLFKTGLAALTTTVAIAFAPTSSAALATYSTDFESSPTSGNIGDGWLNFINQFNADGSYGGGYQYNGGAAPAAGPQVSAINTSEAGPNQGTQVLSVYSDYDNRGFQTNGNPGAVETLVFQEQSIDGANSGIWYFGFDAKDGGVASPASAEAFIKILDGSFQPLPGGLITLDTTSIDANWNRYEISVDLGSVTGTGINAQFGFQTLTGNDVASTNFYDNVTWQQVPSIPVPAAIWLFGSGLLGLVGVARRRKQN